MNAGLFVLEGASRIGTDPETRCHDMNVWKNVVLWFDGIRESAEGSPEQ